MDWFIEGGAVITVSIFNRLAARIESAWYKPTSSRRLDEDLIAPGYEPGRYPVIVASGLIPGPVLVAPRQDGSNGTGGIVSLILLPIPLLALMHASLFITSGRGHL